MWIKLKLNINRENTQFGHYSLTDIPYSGKFLRVLIIAVFADRCETVKFVTSKIL